MAIQKYILVSYIIYVIPHPYFYTIFTSAVTTIRYTTLYQVEIVTEQ